MIALFDNRLGYTTAEKQPIVFCQQPTTKYCNHVVFIGQFLLGQFLFFSVLDLSCPEIQERTGGQDKIPRGGNNPGGGRGGG